MTEHISEEMAKLLVESGWTEAQLEDMSAIAENRAIKQAKQDNVGEAAAGAESGAVLGTAPAGQGSGDIDSMTTELQRLQQLKATPEIMKKRRSLRDAIDSALPAMTVKFDRD